MKKTVIIVLIVALVGFCVYWFGFRNKKTGEPPGSGDGTNAGNSLNGGVLTDKTSTNSIIDSLGLANNVANVVKAKANSAMSAVEAGNEWGKSIKEKASNNGVNLAQQCVLEGLWMTYDTAKLLSWKEYTDATAKVKAL